MHRHPNGTTRPPVATKRPLLAPKKVLRPALKPQPRQMNKQHRGGR